MHSPNTSSDYPIPLQCDVSYSVEITSMFVVDWGISQYHVNPTTIFTLLLHYHSHSWPISITPHIGPSSPTTLTSSTLMISLGIIS